MKNNTRILFAVFGLLAALSPEVLRAGVGEWTSSGPEFGVVAALAAHSSNPSTVYATASPSPDVTYRRLYKSVDAGANWAATGLFGYFDLVVPTSEPSTAYATTTNDIARDVPSDERWRQDLGRQSRPARESFVRDRGSARPDGSLRDDPLGFLPDHEWRRRLGTARESCGQLGRDARNRRRPRRLPSPLRVVHRGSAHRRLPQLRSGARPGTAPISGSRPWSCSSILGMPPASSRSRTAGLHVTTNRGESWRRLWAKQELSLLAIDPADSDRLYMLSDGVVFVSSDGGETVTPLSGGAFGGSVATITASGPGVVLAGSARGVSRSEDAGRRWAAANRGIHEVSVRSLAIDPIDPEVVFAASHGGIYQSSNGGETWIEPSAQSPDATVVAIDPSDRSTVYAAGSGGVYKSTDGGRTWQNNRWLTEYVADLVIDPNNSRRLFAADRRGPSKPGRGGQLASTHDTGR